MRRTGETENGKRSSVLEQNFSFCVDPHFPPRINCCISLSNYWLNKEENRNTTLAFLYWIKHPLLLHVSHSSPRYLLRNYEKRSWFLHILIAERVNMVPVSTPAVHQPCVGDGRCNVISVNPWSYVFYCVDDTSRLRLHRVESASERGSAITNCRVGLR